MKSISSSELETYSRFYRANLINCLTGTKPALLIGTKSVDGRTNLALFSSVVHLGADPAMIGIIQRPLTEHSHTYKNIVSTGFFTVNHIDRTLVAQAHHTSAKFKEEESEFEHCGFSETYSSDWPAPFLHESKLRFGASFVREIHLPENDTRLMIAKIELVELDEKIVCDDGNLNLVAADTIAAAGLETYLTISGLAKFQYAKAGIRPEPLK